MSDFLSRLVVRSQGGRESIRPRLGSLFEPSLPAGMTETQPVNPDIPALSPSDFPAPTPSPLHQDNAASQDSVHVQPGPPSVTVQQTQNPEALSQQDVSTGSPSPAPHAEPDNALPPQQHERYRRTVIADPAIPVSQPSSEPAFSSKPHTSKTDPAQDSTALRPQVYITQPDDSSIDDVGQAATAITPTPPESTASTIRVAPAPQLFPDSEFMEFRKMAEPSPSLTVSPRQESLDSTPHSADHPNLPMTPWMQPLPPLTPPAPEPPTIQVTIGRIDVRAQAPERQQLHPPPARTRPRPALSLDDYLKQRGGSP